MPSETLPPTPDGLTNGDPVRVMNDPSAGPAKKG